MTFHIPENSVSIGPNRGGKNLARRDPIFIAGVQKGGTSTLFYRLASHPDVASAIRPEDQKEIKEMNFFDNFWSRGLDWYRSHFQDPTRASLDATPNYLCAKDAHARMHQHYPDARLIISLRNPVDRAFSQFNHYTQDMPESVNWDWWLPGDRFEDNIDAEMQRPKRKWYGMIGRGFYIDQLEHLTQYYSRDQIHVVVMERWIQDANSMLRGLLDFLELPRLSLTPCVSHVRAYTVDAMDPVLRQRLQELYRPYNQRLFDWLGKEIEQWS